MEVKVKEMPQEDLRKLQLIEVELLLEIDRICRENHIEYFLTFGTLLGAVRHKGYIPWDDDADLVMKRDQYKKFCKICKKELDTKRFFLQNYKTDPYYRWGYAKLRRKGTQYIRAGQEAIKCMSGVSVDIFILDYVPDNYFFRMLHHYIRRGCIKTLWSICGAAYEKNKWLRGLYKILRYVPKQVPNKIMEGMAGLNNRKKRKYLCYTGYFGKEDYFSVQMENRYDTGLKAEWFDTSTEIEFEGHSFRTCGAYKDYLTYAYGNYMELPPVEKRKKHSPSSYNIERVFQTINV